MQKVNKFSLSDCASLIRQGTIILLFMLLIQFCCSVKTVIFIIFLVTLFIVAIGETVLFYAVCIFYIFNVTETFKVCTLNKMDVIAK